MAGGEPAMQAELDLGDRLPLRYRNRGSRLAGVLTMLFGGLFAAVPLAIIALMVLFPDGSRADVLVQVILAVFLLSGLGIMAMGFAVLRTRREVQVDRQWVVVRERGMFSSQQWREPLKQYDGVLAGESYVSGAGNSAGYTLRHVTLRHRESAQRHLPLYASRSRDGFRHAGEKFAGMLELPLLTERADGGTDRREVAELDRSVRERVEAGSLPSPPASLAAVPCALRTRDLDDGQEFRVSFVSVGGFAWSLVLLFAGVSLAVWQWLLADAGDVSTGWLVVAGTLTVFGLLALLVTALGNTSLTVRSDGVVQRLSLGGAHLSERRLAQELIEEVTVCRDVHGRPHLEMAADGGRLVFGHSKLDAAALEHIRGQVVKILAGR